MKSYTVDTWVGDGIDAKVTFDFSPGRPARTYGPPEKCSEEEPADLEITRVIVDGKDYELSEYDTEELTNRMYLEGYDLIAEADRDNDYREFA